MPTYLIDSALSNPADRHSHDTADRVWKPFEIHSQPKATLRAILISDDDADQLVPSVWNFVATERYGFFSQAFLSEAQALATSLCAIARDAENIGDLSRLFFAPLTLKGLVTQMYFFWPRESDDSSLVFPTPALTFCSHIMELRPSWWIEGLNLLSHEQEDLEVSYLWYDSVSISVIQNYATVITEVCLRRGPCYDCPLTVGPLAFDLSLRTFAVYPFAVYPEVEIDGDV